MSASTHFTDSPKRKISPPPISTSSSSSAGSSSLPPILIYRFSSFPLFLVLLLLLLGVVVPLEALPRHSSEAFKHDRGSFSSSFSSPMPSFIQHVVSRDDHERILDPIQHFYPHEILEANSGLALSFALSAASLGMGGEETRESSPLKASLRMRLIGCGDDARVTIPGTRMDKRFHVGICASNPHPQWVEVDVLEGLEENVDQKIVFSISLPPTARFESLEKKKSMALVLSYGRPTSREKRLLAQPTQNEEQATSPEPSGPSPSPERRKGGKGKGRKKNRNRGHHSKAPHKRLCRRVDLYVDFKELNWDGWILSPMGYNAYMCVGECPNPLPARLNATNHAIVQSLINSLNPGVPSPCCVPIETSPLNILYRDLNDTIVFKPYEGMRVEACGCR